MRRRHTGRKPKRYTPAQAAEAACRGQLTHQHACRMRHTHGRSHSIDYNCAQLQMTAHARRMPRPQPSEQNTTLAVGQPAWLQLPSRLPPPPTALTPETLPPPAAGASHDQCDDWVQRSTPPPWWRAEPPGPPRHNQQMLCSYSTPPAMPAFSAAVMCGAPAQQLSASLRLWLRAAAAAAAGSLGLQLVEDVARQIVQLSWQPFEQRRQGLAVGQHRCRVPQLVKEGVGHCLVRRVPLLGRVLQQPRHLWQAGRKGSACVSCSHVC